MTVKQILVPVIKQELKNIVITGKNKIKDSNKEAYRPHCDLRLDFCSFQ